jgi:hypothetical protein
MMSHQDAENTIIGFFSEKRLHWWFEWKIFYKQLIQAMHLVKYK